MNVYTIADDLTEEIGKLTPEQKKKRQEDRKKKAKKGAQKFAFGLAFAALLPIRAAFNAVVAMNINALATNLKWVYDNRQKTTKAEWGKIAKIWKKIGGLQKALLKAISIGAKKKPFFFSKKAKGKFEKRKKSRGISFTGAEVGAIVASASGVIAAIIPPLMLALKKGGQDKAAAQVEQQAGEVVQGYKQAPQQFAQDAAQGAEEQGLFGFEQVLTTAQSGPYSSLFNALGQVANVGIQAAGNAITKKAKKSKKGQKFLATANTATEDLATGAYLRKSGMTETAKQFTGGGLGKILIPAAVVAGAFLLFRKK